MFFSEFNEFVSETAENLLLRNKVVTIESTVYIFESFLDCFSNLFLSEPSVGVERVFLAFDKGVTNYEEEVEVITCGFVWS